MSTTSVFQRLPKAELHRHLDGSLRPDFLCRRFRPSEAPWQTPEEVLEWVRNHREGSLEQYLSLFALTTSALQSRQALYQAVLDVADDWRRENVLYGELRFAPELHTRAGLDEEEVVNTVGDALLEVQRSGSPRCSLILCALRHGDRWQHLPPLWRLARARGLTVGVDLAGAEAGNPPSRFAGLFQAAQEEGVPITIHAGEAAGVDSMEEALQQGALRLGHGIRLVEEWARGEDRLTQRLIRERITLELCPSSNLQTGAWKADRPYPFLEFIRRGIRVTLNTDNTLVSTTTLSREWELIWGGSRYHEEGVLTTLLQGFLAAFDPTVADPAWVEHHVFPALTRELGRGALKRGEVILAKLCG